MLGGRVLGALLAATLSGGSAHAGEANVLLPDMGNPGLTAPGYFDGLYAGVIAGVIGNERHNFFAGGDHAFGGGAALGYNVHVAPGIVFGGEVQAAAGYDPAGNVRYDAFALGRVGFPTSQSVLPYLTGGLGWFDSAAAYALGVGIEAGIRGNLALRGEVLAVGQVGPVPSGNNYPGISAWTIPGGAVWPSGEGCLPADMRVSGSGEPTEFSGLYTAADVGVILNFPYNFFVDAGNGLHLTRVRYGGAVGWNQPLAERVLAGVEVQGGFLFDTSGDITADGFALGRIGLVPTDGLFVYGEAGVGLLQGKPAFAVGGGLEYALWGSAALRGEVLGIGELSTAPAVAGISATKVTLGPVWHFD